MPFQVTTTFEGPDGVLDIRRDVLSSEAVGQYVLDMAKHKNAEVNIIEVDGDLSDFRPADALSGIAWKHSFCQAIIGLRYALRQPRGDVPYNPRIHLVRMLRAINRCNLKQAVDLVELCDDNNPDFAAFADSL